MKLTREQRTALSFAFGILQGQEKLYLELMKKQREATANTADRKLLRYEQMYKQIVENMSVIEGMLKLPGG
jgi:RNA polymerase-interacting CarD/CdnL/TRCF family regulator